MIEDKKIGLKVAENEEELYWTKAKEETEGIIDGLERGLKFNKAVLAMVKVKLKESVAEKP